MSYTTNQEETEMVRSIRHCW